LHVVLTGQRQSQAKSWVSQYYILQAAHGSERIFIFMGGKKGIYIISLLYFTNEESLGR
jgi:hypothetical protein